MLSRGNSDAGAHLRKARSTTSVAKVNLAPKRVGEQDPASTHLHARTAATRAFGTPQAQKAYRDTCQPGITRPYNTTRRSWKSEGSHLSRRRSENVRPRRLQKKPPRARTLGDNAAIPIGLTMQPSKLSFKSSTIQKCQDSSRGCIETKDIYSCQSSAKPLSVFNRDSPQAPHSQRSWFDNTFSTHLKNQPTFEIAADVNIESKLAPVKCAESPSSPLDKARDQVLQDHHEQSIAHLRLMTTRSSRNDTQVYADPQNAPNVYPHHRAVERSASQQFESRSLGEKIRHIPHSLKKVCSRTFRKSSHVQIQVPVQQLAARRSHHFGSDSSVPSRVATCPHSDPNTNHGLLEVPISPPTPPPHQYFGTKDDLLRPSSRSSTNTVKKRNGLFSSESRVTSWTDSSGHNTLKQNNDLTPVMETEHLIRPLAETSSRRTSAATTKKFQGPLRRASMNFKSRAKVDTQRVYSALLRKINTDTSHAKAAGTAAARSDTDEAYCSAPHSHDTSRSSWHDNTSSVRLVDQSRESSLSGSTEGSSARNDQRYLPGSSENNRRGMISPSVYSVHINGSKFTLNEHKPTAASRPQSAMGTATIPISQQTALRWNLARSKNRDATYPAPNTSGDWKDWANQRTSEFDRQASLRLVDFQSQSHPHPFQSHWREQTQIIGDDRDGNFDKSLAPSRLRSSSRSKSGNAERLGPDPIAHMNDRFPIIDTSRERSCVDLKNNRAASTSRLGREYKNHGNTRPQASLRSATMSNATTRRLASNIISHLPNHGSSSNAILLPAPLRTRSSDHLNILEMSRMEIPKYRPNIAPSRSPITPNHRPNAHSEPHELSQVAMHQEETATQQNFEVSSTMSDTFLKDIRKGPYGVASPAPSPSPSPAKKIQQASLRATPSPSPSASSDRSRREARISARRRNGVIGVPGLENVPPPRARLRRRRSGWSVGSGGSGVRGKEGTNGISEGGKVMVEEFLRRKRDGGREGSAGVFL